MRWQFLATVIRPDSERLIRDQRGGGPVRTVDSVCLAQKHIAGTDSAEDHQTPVLARSARATAVTERVAAVAMATAYFQRRLPNRFSCWARGTLTTPSAGNDSFHCSN